MPPSVLRCVTPKKETLFLTALATLGHVGQAAKKTGITPQTWYRHRRADATFAAAWEQALSEAADTVLEPEAIRRAVHGVLKPVYQGGVLVGHVREYSDTPQVQGVGLNHAIFAQKALPAML